LSNTFYRGADCCVIVFDISNQESYEGIEVWKNNFIESVQNPNNDNSGSEDEDFFVPIILVGNKCDLD